MFYKNKQQILSIFLVILFSFGISYKCHATIIPNIEADTYTISLNGTVLNEVKGLNVTIEIKDGKGALAPTASFTANGAVALLSSVSSPTNSTSVITLALNGKITDNKATISGKFAENSLSPGADFKILKIERDGGEDITNLLTTEVTFKNSRAPEVIPSTSSSSSGSTSPPASNTPSTISEEAQDIINNIFIGDNGEEFDLVALGESIDTALANGDLSHDYIGITGNRMFQLKPGAVNNYYLTVTAIVKKVSINLDRLRLSCRLRLRNRTSFDESFFTPYQNFNIAFRKGKISKVTKKIKIPFTSVGQGKDLMENKISSVEVEGSLFCIPYDIENPDIVKYVKEKGLSVNNLGQDDLVRALDYSYLLFDNDFSFNIYAPKAATIKEK